MTKYVILQQDEQSSLVWAEVGHTNASSPARALKGFALDEAGIYVAVPVRNWKPLPVNMEQKTVVTVG